MGWVGCQCLLLCVPRPLTHMLMSLHPPRSSPHSIRLAAFFTRWCIFPRWLGGSEPVTVALTLVYRRRVHPAQRRPPRPRSGPTHVTAARLPVHLPPAAPQLSVSYAFETSPPCVCVFRTVRCSFVHAYRKHVPTSFCAGPVQVCDSRLLCVPTPAVRSSHDLAHWEMEPAHVASVEDRRAPPAC